MLQKCNTHDWSDGSGWIKMLVFTRVYVCVKAKLTLLVLFCFVFLPFPKGITIGITLGIMLGHYARALRKYIRDLSVHVHCTIHAYQTSVGGETKEIHEQLL